VDRLVSNDVDNENIIAKEIEKHFKCLMEAIDLTMQQNNCLSCLMLHIKMMSMCVVALNFQEKLMPVSDPEFSDPVV